MTSSGAKAIVLGAIFLAALVRVGWLAIRVKRTRSWPKTSAKIHSAKLEVMKLDDKNDIELPCLAFSYAAAGGNYSGRFSLFTNGEEEGKSVARKMIDRELQIQYDPKRPSTWYIPDEKIDGFEVERKMS
jgi:hypothetical protein